MGKWGKNPTSPKNEGVLQTYLRHSFMEAMSHLRRVHLHLPDGPNTMDQRRLHNSQWGYLCPVETPDGGSIGTHKHLAHTCVVSEEYDDAVIRKWIESSNGFLPIAMIKRNLFDFDDHNVFLNGVWLGVHQKPNKFVDVFRKERRELSNTTIHWSFSISWNIKHKEIHILTTGGRLMRPLKIKGTKPLSYDMLCPIPEELIASGCEYIDPNEANTLLIGYKDEDTCTHVEVCKTASLGLTALTLPFIEHNPIARNLYATQQSRAAVSVYAANFNSRMDQKSSLLHYGQCPLIHTGVVEKLNKNQTPYGINIIVAIAACSGYNQEDAIIINKSALESGLFVSSYYKTFSLDEDLGVHAHASKKTSVHNVSGNILIVNPYKGNKEVLNMRSNWDYTALDDNGIVKEGTLIHENTVLIGSYQVDKNGNWIDNSLVAAGVHENTYVDRVYLSNTTPRSAKVLTREIRIPIVGDKFASRAAQKATIGIIVPKENMPYTKEGLVPDVIFNPHSFPSRMTIGYFLEMLSGQIGLAMGRLVEVQNFNGVEYPHEILMDVLKNWIKIRIQKMHYIRVRLAKLYAKTHVLVRYFINV